VGTPDFFSGTVRSSIQTSDFITSSSRVFFHAPSVDSNNSFIFAFFIAHFLLVENTYKNPYSLKAVSNNRDKKFCLNLVIWGTLYDVIHGWQADFQNVT
jgi:hypothetical protein